MRRLGCRCSRRIHRFRRNAKEMAAIGKWPVADKTQIGLVHERRGAEGLPGGLRRHFRGGQLPQLVVDQRQQVGGGLAVAVLGGVYEKSEIGHRD